VEIVHFIGTNASQIYPIIEKLGPQIIHLTIDKIEQAAEPLDMTKILAACPRIETLKIPSQWPFLKSTTKLNSQLFYYYKE